MRYFSMAMPVLSFLVLVGLILVAALRPRTNRTPIVLGLALMLLGLVPELPGLNSMISQALLGGSYPRNLDAYYAFWGMTSLVAVCGTALFGWGALNSRPIESAPGAPASGMPGAGWPPAPPTYGPNSGPPQPQYPAPPPMPGTHGQYPQYPQQSTPPRNPGQQSWNQS